MMGERKNPEDSFSPRMWRCFPLKTSATPPSVIFSTYVEVFLLRRSWKRPSEDFLHVCGGVSVERLRISTTELFSPRMWRCFCDP